MGYFRLSAGFEETLRVELAKDLDEGSDEAGPAGLVAGAEAGAVVAVEVLVEEQVVPPVGIVLEFGDAAVDRTPAGGIADEDAGETPADFTRDFEQVHPVSGAGGALDAEVIAMKKVVHEEAADQEGVDGHPDGAAPVGIAAEHAGVGLGGEVGDAIFLSLNREDVGMDGVGAGEGTDAVGAEELVFVEHAGEDAAKAVGTDEGGDAPLVDAEA